jgi:amino acid transporter
MQYFGEFEYVFGCFKLTFIVMLIVLMVCLDTIKRTYQRFKLYYLIQANNFGTARKGAYYDQVVGPKSEEFLYPDLAYMLIYKSRLEGTLQLFQQEIQGEQQWWNRALYRRWNGQLLGHLVSRQKQRWAIVWRILRTTFVNIMFAYIGMDIVAATAAESTSLADAESMKMAARKTNIRIVTLYSLAVLAASFMVPMNHPFINGGGQSVGSHSVFLIAVVEAGLPMAAHFFNAVFVFSSFTCAINSLYVASRVLHTLALREQTGPDFITLRLQHTRSGVPIRAVLVTAAMMLIGFMGRTGSPGEVRYAYWNYWSEFNILIVAIRDWAS